VTIMPSGSSVRCHPTHLPRVRIQLHPLPTQSPKHNNIERVWEDLPADRRSDMLLCGGTLFANALWNMPLDQPELTHAMRLSEMARFVTFLAK
jgi:hypothetical protein